MRRTILLSAVCSLVMMFAASANAQKDRFAGTFVNEDPNTGGITRLILDENDTINVWGRCHPTDCNWGEEAAFAYGSNVAADLRRSGDCEHRRRGSFTVQSFDRLGGHG